MSSPTRRHRPCLRPAPRPCLRPRRARQGRGGARPLVHTFVAVVAATFALAAASHALATPGPAASDGPWRPVGPVYGPVEVLAVRDGDTIVVASNVGPRTVRLIGVDAPEVTAGEAFGAEATVRLESLLPLGAPVWLELDLGLDDVYGRLLAYVYVRDQQGRWRIDDQRVTQVNLAMMEAGWARALAIQPNVTYADLYEDAEERAAGLRLGIWSGAAAPAAGLGAVPEADAAAPPPVDAPGSPGAGPIALHCAMVNPATPNDAAGEWVSVMLSEPLDTRGYLLYDEGSKQVFRLPAGVQPAGELRVDNPGQGVWNNGGDVIYLRRGDVVVDRWAYSGAEAVEGRVLCRQR